MKLSRELASSLHRCRVFTLCKTEHPDDIIGGYPCGGAVLHEVRPYSGTGAAHIAILMRSLPCLF